MTLVVLVLAAVAAGCLLLLWFQGKAHERAEVRWQAERSELLNRIQAPERIPPPENVKVEPFEVSEDLPELAKVGTLIHEDGEGGDASDH